MRSTSRSQHTDFSRCFVSLCSSSLGVITLYSWNKFNMHQIENKLFDFTSTQQKSQNLKCRSILRYKKKEFWHENINNIHVYKISMCSAVQPQLATHNQKKNARFMIYLWREHAIGTCLWAALFHWYANGLAAGPLLYAPIL